MHWEREGHVVLGAVQTGERSPVMQEWHDRGDVGGTVFVFLLEQDDFLSRTEEFIRDLRGVGVIE